MKVGDYFLDEYYSPEETIVMQITHEGTYAGCYTAKIVYTTNPDRVPKDSIETVWSNDEYLVRVAVINIDNKPMMFEL